MESIETLKNKILLFNEFLIDNLGMPSEFFIETNNIIKRAYEDQNIRILKAGNNDMLKSIKEMPLKTQLELKKIFKEKLGLDLDILEKQFDKNVEKIIKRGKINNDDEYILLLDKMDNLSNIKTDDEINIINSMLLAYNKKL